MDNDCGEAVKKHLLQIKNFLFNEDYDSRYVKEIEDLLEDDWKIIHVNSLDTGNPAIYMVFVLQKESSEEKIEPIGF